MRFSEIKFGSSVYTSYTCAMKQLKSETTAMVRVDKKVIAKMAKEAVKRDVSIGKLVEMAFETLKLKATK